MATFQEIPTGNMRWSPRSFLKTQSSAQKAMPRHVLMSRTNRASFKVIGAAAAILGPSELAQALVVPARAQSAQTCLSSQADCNSSSNDSWFDSAPPIITYACNILINANGFAGQFLSQTRSEIPLRRNSCTAGVCGPPVVSRFPRSWLSLACRAVSIGSKRALLRCKLSVVQNMMSGNPEDCGRCISISACDCPKVLGALIASGPK